jgi:hypothetical protein
VRFLSVEPQLEAVDLSKVIMPDGDHLGPDTMYNDGEDAGIDWVICGGESGPHARPFNLAWAESLQDQCKSAGVAFFMKQLGSKPVRDIGDADNCPLKLKDRKGVDPSEWPESLRVREFPA